MVGGGLLQLVAYGAQDVYLTGSPQITFWKVNYGRHSNFSVESYKMNTYGRNYNNFEIQFNQESDDFDLNVDMIYPITINLCNLNNNELFENCQVVKKKKEKKKQTGSGGGSHMFSYIYRNEKADCRKHQQQNQRQIKSQINMKRR